MENAGPGGRPGDPPPPPQTAGSWPWRAAGTTGATPSSPSAPSRSWGRDVAYLPLGRERPRPDPLLRARPAPDRLTTASTTAFAGAAVLVDGILGTGARGSPRARGLQVIHCHEPERAPIVALDIPSGVDPTTGAVPGTAVNGRPPSCSAGPRPAPSSSPVAPGAAGWWPWRSGSRRSTTTRPAPRSSRPDWARARLPDRSPRTPTRTPWAGSPSWRGGRGWPARRPSPGTRPCVAGAGYVRVVSEEANRAIVQAPVPEALFVDRSRTRTPWWRRWRSRTRCSSDPPSAPVRRPRRYWTRCWPARRPGLRPRRGRPHDPGRPRRARAAGSARAVRPDSPPRRDGAAHGSLEGRDPGRPHGGRPLAGRRHRAAVLLKGAPSVVATPGERRAGRAVGSSDLATAAMGDQLGAETAAFLAAGRPPADAAGLGLFYGGRAAELAGRAARSRPTMSPTGWPRLRRPRPPASPSTSRSSLFDQPPRW
jgi:ADP-dependent NAD(P)H-hydrate dehydratase / NAD(P)H-hydrate epimerase